MHVQIGYILDLNNKYDLVLVVALLLVVCLVVGSKAHGSRIFLSEAARFIFLKLNWGLAV